MKFNVRQMFAYPDYLTGFNHAHFYQQIHIYIPPISLYLTHIISKRFLFYARVYILTLTLETTYAIGLRLKILFYVTANTRLLVNEAQNSSILLSVPLQS